MKKPLAYLVALLFAVTPVLACDDTKDQFLERIAKLNPQVFKAKPEAVEKLNEFVNTNRATNGSQPVLFDEFYIGHFVQGNMPMAGLLAVRQGCVVDDLTMAVPSEYLVRILVGADLSVDDFIEVKVGQDS